MCESITPKPLIRPRFNISDIILIKVVLTNAYKGLPSTLKDRIDIIIAELKRAEQESEKEFQNDSYN